MTDLATAPISETPVSSPAVTEAPDKNQGTYVPGEQAPVQSDETESRARAMGWVPKENYRGNPDNWKEADEFVRRGEEILPIVQERNRDLTRKLSELENRVASKEAEYSGTIANMERMTVLALNRQREQLSSGYANAMRDAASQGDVQRYDQLSRDHAQAVQNFDQRVHEQIKPPAPAAPPAPQEAQAWVEKNKSWFIGDQSLNLEAQAIHLALVKDHPYMSLAENLDRVERTIKQRYPQKFGLQTQSSTVSYGAVEGGASRAPSSSRAKGASDLPADAKVQAERFVKQGLFKDVAEYARDYFAQ